MDKNYVSKFAIGTAQLGQLYGIANKTGKPKKENALDIINYAFSKGVDTFDTAPEYGDSESLIGEYLNQQKTLKRKLPTIITKIPSVKLDCSCTTEDIFKHVRKNIVSSLSKLKIDSLEACLLHNPEDMKSYKGDVVSSLIKLKNEGLIKKIGVSVYSPDEAKLVVDLGCFDCIQIPFNLLDQRWIHTGLLYELSEHKIEIYARSIYLQGLIFLDPNELPPNLQNAKKPLERLRRLSVDTGLSQSELSMLFVRDMPQIKKIVIGCETKQQLKHNLKIITSPRLSDEIVNEILYLFKDVSELVINPKMWN